MFNHPGASALTPKPMGAPGGTTAPRVPGAPMTPSPAPLAGQAVHKLGGAPHPAAMPNERMALNTTMARQRSLASALRGGMASGVPAAAPHFLVSHAQGLPGIK